MKKTIIITLFFFVSIFVNLTNLSLAYYTIFQNSTYDEWKQLDGLCSENTLAVSSFYINETKYFVFTINEYNITVERYNQYGNREAINVFNVSTVSTVNCKKTFMPYFLNEIIFYCYNSTGYKEYYAFNLTNYSIKLIGKIRDIDTNPDLFSPYPISKGIGSGDFKTNYLTFAIIHSNSIYYNFYDFETHSFNLNNLKRIDNFKIGITDLKNEWLYSSENYCFKYPGCLFHYIYYGKSSANNNRLGLYVREIYKGMWGVDVYDIPLISSTTDSDCVNFIDCYDGEITNFWFSSDIIGAFKVYFRIKTNDGKIFYAYKLYNETFYPIIEQIINAENSKAIHSNAFVILNKNQILNQNNNSITFYNKSFGNMEKIYLVGRIKAYTNNLSTLKGYLILQNNDIINEIEIFSSYNNGYRDLFIFKNISIDNKKYNITFKINASSTTYNISLYSEELAFDIYYSDKTLTRKPNLLIIRGIGSYQEAFLIYYCLFSEIKYIQIPLKDCVCSEFLPSNCYNSTYRIYIRECYPNDCSYEEQLRYDLNCEKYQTSLDKYEEKYEKSLLPSNIVSNLEKSGYEWVSLFISPLFISIISLLCIATVITMNVGKYTKATNLTGVFLGVCLILVLIYSILGLLPMWIAIVIIIGLGLLIAKTMVSLI